MSTNGIFAIVGRDARLVERVAREVTRECERLGAHVYHELWPARCVHPANHADYIADIPRPALLTTMSPYLLNHFDATNVWVLAPNTPHAKGAKLLAHSEHAKWSQSFETGELWSHVGENWVSSSSSLLVCDALIKAISSELCVHSNAAISSELGADS